MNGSIDRDPAQNQNTLSSGAYEALANAAESLLVERSEPLYADEDSDEVTGWLRQMTAINSEIPGAGISISIYYDHEQGRQADLLRAVVEVDRPIGAIQFGLSLDNTRLVGTIYLESNGQAKGNFEYSFSNLEELYSEDSEACFNLMNAMGLGAIWTRDVLYKGEKEDSATFDVDDRIALDLTQFLLAQRGQKLAVKM